MTVDNGNMTPISQHSFSLASVSYIGPAHTEQHGGPPAPAPVLRPVDQVGQLRRTELDQPASVDRFVAFPDAA